MREAQKLGNRTSASNTPESGPQFPGDGLIARRGFPCDFLCINKRLSKDIKVSSFRQRFFI